MPTPIQGQDVLILVEVPTGSGTFVEVASQKNAQFQGQTPTIDLSGKTDQSSVFAPGRPTDTLNLESMYVPGDQALLNLRNAYRTRQPIKVRRRELGLMVEEAVGIITSYQEGFQDQQGATVSVTLQISGPWVVL